MLGEVIRVEPELIIECRELKTLSILGTQVHPGMIEVIEDAELHAVSLHRLRRSLLVTFALEGHKLTLSTGLLQR